MQRLTDGDPLLLYTTRGCFRNPGRDRGRVIGEARASSPVAPLSEPVEIAGRRFELGFDSLAPRGAGVIVAELVEELDAFPDPASWSARMRRPLVALPPHDHKLISARLAPQLVSAGEALSEYLHLARPRLGVLVGAYFLASSWPCRVETNESRLPSRSVSKKRS